MSDLKKKAKDLYLKSGGKWGPSRIAEELGGAVKSADISRWKHREKWAEELKDIPKSVGAPSGNSNATGNSTPHGPAGGIGNKNAIRSGAWASPRMSKFPHEQQDRIRKLCDEVRPHGERYAVQLEMYLAKQQDLENRLKAIDAPDTDETTFLDRKTTVEKDDMVMSYYNEDTKASRRAKLEQELNRVQGRISKLYAEIRAIQEADRRYELEKIKFQFQKDKALGVYDLDDDGNLQFDVPSEEDDEVVE